MLHNICLMNDFFMQDFNNKTFKKRNSNLLEVIKILIHSKQSHFYVHIGHKNVSFEKFTLQRA